MSRFHMGFFCINVFFYISIYVQVGGKITANEERGEKCKKKKKGKTLTFCKCAADESRQMVSMVMSS